jgi:hypothetical protein
MENISMTNFNAASTFRLTLLRLTLACAAITLSLAVCAQGQTFTTLGNFTGFNGDAPFFGNMVQAPTAITTGRRCTEGRIRTTGLFSS